MRWDSFWGTGGVGDIAFMVVDVVKRELGTDLFRGVWSCVAGQRQRMETYVFARSCNG